MRSSGLLVGLATLNKAANASSSSNNDKPNGGRGAVYLSGFRIVQDAMETRHAEYRIVLVEAQYEQWHRFSELKALTRLPALSRDSAYEASRDAWDGVRECKAPKGRGALDPGHLSRKCLAIERFLIALLDELPAARLAELLSQVPKPRRVAPRRKTWRPVAYPAPTHASRVPGLKLRMR